MASNETTLREVLLAESYQREIDGLKAEVKRLTEERDELRDLVLQHQTVLGPQMEKEIEELRAALLESQANDRCAMGYLSEVRAIVGGDDFPDMVKRVSELHEQLETERIRLAACGVVAMADTPESAKEARTMEVKYHSASCDDVARRVDECMVLRSRLKAAEEVIKIVRADEQSKYFWDALANYEKGEG